MWRSVVAGLFGNALEWYDFLLYASFAPLFAKLFFVATSPFIATLLTFSVFAIGFIVRPLGGMLIGHYADIYGRRYALILSVSIMTASTICIGFLPTTETIGIAAPILFTLCRMVQGIAVGGELPSSATYLIEHMFPTRRGFAGSLVLSTAFLGIMAGAVVAAMLSRSLDLSALSSWGWRVAYWLGGLLGLLGIYLRVYAHESPEFAASSSLKLPVAALFSHHTKAVLVASSLTSLMALGNYLVVAFIPSFLVNYTDLAIDDALLINMISLCCLTIFIPLFGLLSDTIGTRRLYIMAALALVVCTYPIFYLINSGVWIQVVTAEIVLCLLLAPLNATVPSLLIALFPANVRTSGVSLGYNVGQALFGGTAPLVAFSLIELSGSTYSPAWYLVSMAAAVCATATFTLKTRAPAAS